MSSADEILFAPLSGSDAPWRAQCYAVVEHLEQQQKEKNKRPAGSLLLESLMEAYHVRGQKTFWVVNSADGLLEWDFYGTVLSTPDGATVNETEEDCGEDVVELNLFPDVGNDTYVFADQKLAQAYERIVRR